MFIRSPAVVWGYVTLVMLFSAVNIMGLPYPGPSAPVFSFYRDQNKTVGEVFPSGLWQLNHTALKSSINQLPTVRILREVGNSLRLATGQRLKWVIWGSGKPLMLFATIELPVSSGLNTEVAGQLTKIAENIANYQQRLSAEGWTLVVVPVPTKLGIHRELVHWPIYDSDLVNLRPLINDRSDEFYSFLRARLDEKKIPNVDLGTVYRKALAVDPDLLLYATNDSHWSGAGIRIAAQTTANTISKISPLKSRTPFRPTFYKVKHVGDIAKAHDPWPRLTTWLSPIWEFEDLLLNGEELNGYTYSSSPAGLVAAVGTSYTGQYTWLANQPVGFAWQLSLYLNNVQVQNHPVAGLGSFYSFEQFWKNHNQISSDFSTKYGDRKPKIVVWEFPIRDVFMILQHPTLPE